MLGYEYASIVRATLSQYELVLLFYNGISHPKFKKLIEKYAILNNLRPELLATEADQELYKGKKGDEYTHAMDDGRILEMEYHKSAFIFKKA